MPSEYNKMHELLVKNNKDFVGMIAYSIYKGEKKAAIRNNITISEFTKLKSQKNEISRYKREAEQLATIFLQTAADDEIKKIKRELTAKINALTLEDLPKDPLLTRFSKWHRNGAAGVVGNFWTAVIVAMFVYVFSDAGLWEKAKDTAVSRFTTSIPTPPKSDNRG